MSMQRQSGDEQQIARVLEEDRRETEHLAQQLWDQAARHQQKAIEGLIALPAAMALRVAAVTLQVVSFMARGLEVFQRSAMEARETAEQYRTERERAEPGKKQEQPRA
jgi:hypothetical protein